jgi:plasmid stability protein
MASLTIRNVDDKLKSKLRLEAARHGWSMEEEVRQILRGAMLAGESEESGLAITEKIKRRFAGLRADEIELPARRAPRLPPNLKTGK